MAGQTILREYLMSLGFKVDSTGQRKFNNVIGGITKGAGAAGLSLGALGGTMLAMATQYATAMEKMYYASRRGGGTVGQMQAMEFAGQQVGLAAGTMSAAVTTMASKIRMNKGLIGLLSQLGVETKGRTPVQEMMDLIDKTASMDYTVGASIAEKFGLDEGTYQVMRQNRKEMREAMEEQIAFNKEMGVDVDANAEAMAKFGKNVGQLKMVFEAFKGVIAGAMLEPMKEAVGVSKELLKDWTRIINGPERKTSMLEDAGVVSGATGPGGGVVMHGQSGIGFGKAFDSWRRGMIDKLYGPGAANKRLGPSEYSSHSAAELASLDSDFKLRGGGGAAAAGGGSDASHGFSSQAERYAAIEKMWGLTPGTLQSLRNLESADGKNMGSGKRNKFGLGGIVGDFQMNSANQKHYGVTDKFDEADAAGEMFADLKKQFGTDAAAAAAWNGGTAAGNRGPAHGVNPAETQAFVPKFMSGLQQTNNITVNGGGPGVAAAVKQGLAEANGDLVRNMKTVVR